MSLSGHPSKHSSNTHSTALLVGVSCLTPCEYTRIFILTWFSSLLVVICRLSLTLANRHSGIHILSMLITSLSARHSLFYLIKSQLELSFSLSPGAYIISSLKPVTTPSYITSQTLFLLSHSCYTTVVCNLSGTISLPSVILMLRLFPPIALPSTVNVALACFCLGVLFLRPAMRRYIITKFTIIHDIPQLGTSRAEEDRVHGTAVVCGGSIAGLLAARVCADHFRNVIIVEPEDLFDESGDALPPEYRRKRVLQYMVYHGFQPINLLALRKLFPDIDREILKSGGRILPANYNMHYSGVKLLFPESGDIPETMHLSRASYETILRRLISSGKYPNIQFVSGTVTGVDVSSGGTSQSIPSVIVRPSNATISTSPTHLISSALVVDCTGHTPYGGLKWLQRGGYIYPTDLREVYDPRMHYVSFCFKIPEEEDFVRHLPIPGGYKSSGIIYSNFADPELDNKTILFTWSNPNKLSIVLGGWGISERPKTVEEMSRILKNFNGHKPIPNWLFQTIDMVSKYLDPSSSTDIRVPPLTYVRYDKAQVLPENFVALGDSLIRTNPVFGQGCAKIATEAILLNRLLWEGRKSRTLPKAFGKRYFSIQHSQTGHIWHSNKLSDYGFSTTVPIAQETLSRGGLYRSIRKLVISLCSKDPDFASMLYPSMMLLDTTVSLLCPTSILKVFREYFMGGGLDRISLFK
ncbi:hypothetical protein FRC02_005706 [Tulasnella sp. 418]|nr:hypothetical protein FRC02_005706 [Tulasnella sp. 418]